MGDAPTSSTSCVGQSSAAAADGDTAEVVVGENDAAAKEGSGYYAADSFGDSTNIVSAAMHSRASGNYLCSIFSNVVSRPWDAQADEGTTSTCDPAAAAVHSSDDPSLNASTSSRSAKRLASSLEKVGLLESLPSEETEDLPPPPAKRQSLTLFTESPRPPLPDEKKTMMLTQPSKLIADALKPSLRSQTSLEVADGEGDTPLRLSSGESPPDRKSSLTKGSIHRRSIDGKRTAAGDTHRVAFRADSFVENGDLSRLSSELRADAGKEWLGHASSAAQMGEAFSMDEENTGHLPPAPPSTPATKEMFSPHPFLPSAALGKLSYSNLQEARGEEDAPGESLATAALETTIPKPPQDSPADCSSNPIQLTEESSSTLQTDASLTQEVMEATSPDDISGAATEPRRGGGVHRSGSKQKLRRKFPKSAGFEKWDVGKRYQLERMLGRGSYGEVAQSVDLQARNAIQHSTDAAPPHKNASYVAVKRISKVFDQEVDAVRLFREMHILRRLKGHANIIKLIDVIQPRDREDFNELYLVFEYVDTDLYKLIMSPQYLSTEHIQTFLYQILVGVKYIHSSSGEIASGCANLTGLTLIPVALLSYS